MKRNEDELASLTLSKRCRRNVPVIRAVNRIFEQETCRFSSISHALRVLLSEHPEVKRELQGNGDTPQA